MRTHLEFRSDAFPACPGEDEEINPGRYGKRLAEFIAAELPRKGYRVRDVYAEDWGWVVELDNAEFPLWVGVGNYEEYDDGFLCFIEPSKPFVRRWFRSVPTGGTIERLANAMEQVIRDSGKARDMKWWSDADSGRK